MATYNVTSDNRKAIHTSVGEKALKANYKLKIQIVNHEQRSVRNSIDMRRSEENYQSVQSVNTDTLQDGLSNEQGRRSSTNHKKSLEFRSLTEK